METFNFMGHMASEKIVFEYFSIFFSFRLPKQRIIQDNVQNVGKKSQEKKSQKKKSQFWVGKKVTGKKVTKKNYAFSHFLVRNKHYYFYYYHFYHFVSFGLMF